MKFFKRIFGKREPSEEYKEYKEYIQNIRESVDKILKKRNPQTEDFEDLIKYTKILVEAQVNISQEDSYPEDTVRINKAFDFLDKRLKKTQQKEVDRLNKKIRKLDIEIRNLEQLILILQKTTRGLSEKIENQASVIIHLRSKIKDAQKELEEFFLNKDLLDELEELKEKNKALNEKIKNLESYQKKIEEQVDSNPKISSEDFSPTENDLEQITARLAGGKFNADK